MTVKTLLAAGAGGLGFATLGDETWFPLPFLLLFLAVEVGIRNLQGLLSPPYLRLSIAGIALRVSPWLPGGRASLAWILTWWILPIRRCVTVQIPWDRLTALKPYRNAISGIAVEHTMTIAYVDDRGGTREITFSRGEFSLTPQLLAIAIQRYCDREFHWQPLRARGALEDWARSQEQTYREPLLIRYRPSRLFLWAGVLGSIVVIGIVLLVLLRVATVDAVCTGWGPWAGAVGLIALLCGMFEMEEWIRIGRRRVLCLSAEGFRVGGPSAAPHPWREIVSARLRVTESSFMGGLPTPRVEGLDVAFADGTTVFLPHRYDFRLDELEQILTPKAESPPA